MLISERIYKYLEEKKISQIEFAKRTGISHIDVQNRLEGYMRALCDMK